MYNHSELMEILGEAEMAYVSAEFWSNLLDVTIIEVPDGKNIRDYPDHPIWKELLSFQNGWLACKETYKIRD